MVERRGTLGPVDEAGRRRLILPGQVVTLVSGQATDDEIKAEFGLDLLVHSGRLVLSPSGGVCLDGPAAGVKLDYVTNEVGDMVVDFDGSPRYQVTSPGDERRPAELRHVPDGVAVTGRIAVHTRFAGD
ncbi:hypothetical protein [Actinoplanes derwentensis]|uniref:Uncharacterized protein n=1 Tax=Actinoplanes derwentensis TaxID=113562 RepID=A0A1H1YUK4_9ACTN|nr:hypothetical protein [Actinoplanes derwentensis]GID81281.1 hypothetical protein Ade03nite_02050 [Actinoplanes derwentensis]SDT24696.1 hypothetical protein SAMN04489716_2990 [Actinoplanes derwentensis]